VDDNKSAVLDINAFLHNNSEDWSRPIKDDSPGALSITWPYVVDKNEIAYFTASFKPITRTDGNTDQQGEINFGFPYKAQYDEYLQYVVANSTLVNTFTDNGCIYRIYDSAHYTWSFIIIPASVKKFFMDGVPTEAYNIKVRRRP